MTENVRAPRDAEGVMPEPSLWILAEKNNEASIEAHEILNRIMICSKGDLERAVPLLDLRDGEEMNVKAILMNQNEILCNINKMLKDLLMEFNR